MALVAVKEIESCLEKLDSNVWFDSISAHVPYMQYLLVALVAFLWSMHASNCYQHWSSEQTKSKSLKHISVGKQKKKIFGMEDAEYYLFTLV